MKTRSNQKTKSGSSPFRSSKGGILVILLLLFSLLGYGQQFSITGKITDTEQTPIPGVNIVIKGTTTGTVTDLDGNYTLKTDSENITIVFSAVGYIAEEVSVTGSQEINIVLEEELTALSEVVVVGYGVQKKALVTGAISSLKSEDLQGSNAFLESELQGKTSGVTVLPTSGSPGADVKIRIRGTSSNGKAEPLYIVDGIKVGSINFLDPNDIASVEILKDGASSAIYGAEGGNGVILISTKKGGSGAGVVNYSFETGIQSPVSLPELMNASQYTTYLGENNVTLKSNPANTDWLSEVFQNAPMQKHYLSVSGGSDKASIIGSISYLDQDGILGGEKSNYTRVTGRINADYQAKEWLKVGANIGYTYSDRAALNEDSRLDGAVARALLIDPLTPVTHEADDLEHIQTGIDNLLPYSKDADGNYYGVSKYTGGEIVNPVLTMELSKGSTKRNQITGSSFIDITPIKDLTYTSRLGFDYGAQNYHTWSPTYYYSSERNVSSTSVQDNIVMNSRWQWENFITYSKTINENTIGVVVGSSIEQRYTRYLNATTGPMNLESESFTQHDYTTYETQVVRGNLFEDKLASFFGRLSYDYANKYLLEATIRKDGAGTSKLPSGKNWGTFPSVSAGWVFSNESFWTVDVISYAKIRASWGQNGSLSNLPYFSYSDDMSASGQVYPTSAGKLPVFEPYTQGNEDLTWETSEQMDIGLDLRALNNKLSFTFDYFNKKTLDLLTLGTPSATAGASSPYFNAGDVENKGLEFELGYRNYDNEFKYGISANLTTLKNNVTRLDEDISIIYGTKVQPSWDGATAFSEGEPIWYFRGYKTNGIDPATGQPIFVDLAGGGVDGDEPDGLITSDDKTNIGDPHPDMLYGANLNLEYKGFDFLITLQGSKGNDVLLGWLRDDRANINYPAFIFEDRWTSSTPNASQPRMDRYNETSNPDGLDPNYYQSDLLVFDGSYMKIRQIQLGYTIPSSLFKEKISALRLYVSLDNYFTFTKYKGMDPEAGSIDPNTWAIGDSKGIGRSQGIDRGTYPIPKKVMFGCSLTF
jgi:TonB-dependent starch-binding outer membrane protein SusC